MKQLIIYINSENTVPSYAMQTNFKLVKLEKVVAVPSK